MGYAVVLHANAPPEIHVLLSDFLSLHKGLAYLFSRSISTDGRFLHCEFLSDKTDKAAWKVRIPVEFAMAIIDMSDEQQRAGFLAEFPSG